MRETEVPSVSETRCRSGRSTAGLTRVFLDVPALSDATTTIILDTSDGWRALPPAIVGCPSLEQGPLEDTPPRFVACPTVPGSDDAAAGDERSARRRPSRSGRGRIEEALVYGRHDIDTGARDPRRGTRPRDPEERRRRRFSREVPSPTLGSSIHGSTGVASAMSASTVGRNPSRRPGTAHGHTDLGERQGPACSSRKTPFLLDVTTSSRPSPLKSATTNWVPMPLWSSISRGVKAILPSGPRLASNQ